MSFLGDLVASVGNKVGAPELGWSERLGSTGQIPTKQQEIANQIVDPTFSPFTAPVWASNNLFGDMERAGDAAANQSSQLSAGGAASFDPAAIAYYNDQEAQARQAIDRLNAQRGIGQGNIAGAYQSALDNLLGSNSQAERDAGLTKQRTIDDNVAARSNVDQTVSRQAQGLRRLLGNSSSAAQFAAPLAVARQGNQQQGAIQTSFGRNLQNIDIADEDRKKAFGSAQEDLGRQRTVQENQLNAGLLQTEAGLNETLSNIALQRAQAQGQNYAQARGSIAPFNDRVSSLLSQIDQLGANPAIAAKNVAFTAPTLDQYNTSGIKVAQGQTPAQRTAGQYFNIFGDDQRKKLGLV